MLFPEFPMFLKTVALWIWQTCTRVLGGKSYHGNNPTLGGFPGFPSFPKIKDRGPEPNIIQPLHFTFREYETLVDQETFYSFEADPIWGLATAREKKVLTEHPLFKEQSIQVLYLEN